MGLLEKLVETMNKEAKKTGKEELKVDISYFGTIDGIYDMNEWYKSEEGRRMLRTERVLLSFYAWFRKIHNSEIDTKEEFQRNRETVNI